MSKLSDVVLHAEKRDERGKEKAKKLRQNLKVPAVLYGRNLEKAQAITLDGHEMLIASEHAHGELHMFDLELGGDSFRIVFKEIQRDPVTGKILHADLIRADDNAEVTLSAPVVQIGDVPEGAKLGGTLERVSFRINVRGVAEKLPSAIKVDLSSLPPGGVFAIRDLPDLDGVTYVDGPERVLYTITSKRGAAAEPIGGAAEEGAEPAVEGEEEGAEGEGEAGAETEKAEA